MYQRRGKPKPVDGKASVTTDADQSSSQRVNDNVTSASTDIIFNEKWAAEYDSPPIVNKEAIWIVGIFLFSVAYIWPPVILFITFLASQFVPYAFRRNDEAVERRKQFKEFVSYKKHPKHFRNIQQYVNFQEKFWENDRGMLLHTSIMTPKDKPIKAVVCYCHGYTDHTSFSKRIEFQRLVHAGIAVVMIEYEGHGRSDGPLGLIPSWDRLVNDVCAFFKETITTDPILRDSKVFLMGESMGGAVAFFVYNKLPELFSGVVFICPMCKIKEDMLPPKIVVDILANVVGPTGHVSLFGYLPIGPSKRLDKLSFHYPEKGRVIRTSPTTFSGRKPRLATARELLQTTKFVSSNLSDFSAPFLVLHGKEDKITDPVLSQSLYHESKSTDKSIKLYDGLWHALTSGETVEDMDMVFYDIIQWILKRS